jgi:hypothetical protein
VGVIIVVMVIMVVAVLQALVVEGEGVDEGLLLAQQLTAGQAAAGQQQYRHQLLHKI